MGTLIAFDTDVDAKFEPVESSTGAVTGIVIYETVLKPHRGGIIYGRTPQRWETR